MQGILRSSFSAFRRSCGGNIAILTALLLVPILGIGGLAVDYSISSLQHARLTALADSTALLGARRAKAIIEEGVGRTSPRIDGLEGELAKHFSNESAQIKGVNRKVEIDRNSQDIIVTVNWTVNIPSVFGKLFGQQSYQIAGKSASTVSLKPFMQLFVLVDVSQSMGIGASEDDQIRMVDREGCMFACHLPVANSRIPEYKTKTSYETARLANPPIETRVDVARRGVLDIVKMAKEEAATSSNRIKFGIYTFSNSLQTIVDIDQPISSELDEVEKRVERDLILGKTEGGTNLAAALTAIERKIRNPGDGSSPHNPKVVVIVLSDGVMNSTMLQKSATGGVHLSVDPVFHKLPVSVQGAIQEPRSKDSIKNDATTWVYANGKTQWDLGRFGVFDPGSCQRLKDRDVTLMVIESQYVMPPPGPYYRKSWDGTEDVRFAWLDGWRLEKVSSAMAQCATSRQHFAIAGDGNSILKELQTLGALALKNYLRLAN